MSVCQAQVASRGASAADRAGWDWARERTAGNDAETLYLAGNIGGRGAVLGFILCEQGVLISHRARNASFACRDVLGALPLARYMQAPQLSDWTKLQSREPSARLRLIELNARSRNTIAIQRP